MIVEIRRSYASSNSSSRCPQSRLTYHKPSAASDLNRCASGGPIFRHPVHPSLARHIRNRWAEIRVPEAVQWRATRTLICQRVTTLSYYYNISYTNKRSSLCPDKFNIYCCTADSYAHSYGTFENTQLRRMHATREMYGIFAYQLTNSINRSWYLYLTNAVDNCNAFCSGL